ncbi:uncharacterized protein LOC141587948 [Silene latifolia]|uniref:uncharacterized protein LOC141587948 n=1 Tax=Silene latifolia TaxID=37657 RepID=UPI003D77D252
MKLYHGQMNELARKFNVCRKTITELWNEAKKQRAAGIAINVNSKMKGKVCKARLLFDEQKFMNLALNERTTELSIAAAMGVPQSTVAKWVKMKLIRSHTSAIKPGLNDKNKLNRLLFCLKALHFDQLINKVLFNDQSNVIHLDEKWFYLTKKNERYYLTKSEALPHRTCQPKAFIPNVMFICAVGRPVYDINNEVIFDGKFGIFPLITKEPAKRNSKNRIAGTLETKPIDSITKLVIKDMLINIVLPAIKAKWPSTASKHIIIQHDNARPHIDNSDPDFRAAATADGWNIELKNQPPNSPDLNVLDLGFFRAIQSLQ